MCFTGEIRKDEKYKIVNKVQCSIMYKYKQTKQNTKKQNQKWNKIWIGNWLTEQSTVLSLVLKALRASDVVEERIPLFGGMI